MKGKRTRKTAGESVIRTADENYKIVKCAFCKGRGVDPFPVLSYLSRCPVCQGRGAVRIKFPYDICPACGGTGVYTRSRLYCWTCRGKGLIHTSTSLSSNAR